MWLLNNFAFRRTLRSLVAYMTAVTYLILIIEKTIILNCKTKWLTFNSRIGLLILSTVHSVPAAIGACVQSDNRLLKCWRNLSVLFNFSEESNYWQVLPKRDNRGSNWRNRHPQFQRRQNFGRQERQSCWKLRVDVKKKESEDFCEEKKYVSLVESVNLKSVPDLSDKKGV